MTRPILAFALAVATIAAPFAVRAETMQFHTTLSGGSEVPTTDSKGTGTVDATLDTSTKTLTWTVTYSELTGPATAAHFHGPAMAGANAKPVVPMKGSLASPMKGSAELTDEQVKQLEGGQWYFNIHTAKHPGGEIRGQMMKGGA